MTHSLACARVRRCLKTTGIAAALTMGVTTLSSAAFAEPVALILDKSEGIEVSAFTELLPGDVVDLGPDGHIDLLDYAACQEVRVKSGIITVASSGYVHEGGEEKVLRAGNCLKADADANTDSAAKGLTVTLRGLSLSDKKAAALMLRFDDDLRSQYDTVFVSFEGGAPKRFDVMDNILTDMPAREDDDEAVDVELFLQGKAPDFGVVMRKFTIDPIKVGRKTAVVIVK
jgi:hypothetical protein